MRYKTLKIRVKDRHSKLLNTMAREVNFVWNYCNETSLRAIRRDGKFLSRFEMSKYTGGASKEMSHLPQQAINAVGTQYVLSRKESIARRKRETATERAKAKAKAAAKGRKRKPSYVLRFRKSHGAKRSLGWVPVTAQTVVFRDGGIKFAGTIFKLFNHYGIDESIKIKSGSFTEDSRGKWHFCPVVEVHDEKPGPSNAAAVGIDPGCKSAFTTSDGDVLHGRWYRDLEGSLAIAQRANRGKRAAAIHAKISARRNDALHKLSTYLADNYSHIFIGDADSVKLAQTMLGKSVLDAGWGKLKLMLDYKCADRGTEYAEVSERYSTRKCSSCGELTGPSGVSDLGLREWECSECGVHHDRDVNAAINIRNTGASGRVMKKVA